ncbi:MAG: hypothetical protein ACRD9W_29165, partial [Terriglobia bacterium]
NWTGAGGVNRQFSETDAWQTKGFTTTTTDNSLSFVVGFALQSYVNGNFPHKFLGGRLAALDKPGVQGGTVNGSQAYSCDVMSRVWEQARCQNFDAIAAQDGFRDFNWYEDPNNDPRKLPATLSSCKALTDSNKALGQNTLKEAYDLALKAAFNGNKDMFALAAADDTDPNGNPYKTDDVKTYFDLILPDKCSDKPIQTGVKITRGGASSDDAVCPNPGCSLTGGNCQ